MNKQEQNQTKQNNEQEEGLTCQDIKAQIITKAWKDEAYKQKLPIKAELGRQKACAVRLLATGGSKGLRPPPKLNLVACNW